MRSYASPSTWPRHGHTDTPSCAGTHGMLHASIGALRAMRVLHRRNGTAVSIASRTSPATRPDGNGPRYELPSSRAARVTVRRGKRSVVNFTYAYARHVF